MSSELLYRKAETRPADVRMITRYLAFIASRPNIYQKGVTHLHHILPKARDFFPEYKDLKAHTWNGVFLTTREHFIAHWMLARAFPKSSQVRAFYNFSNIIGARRSRLYATAREEHIEAASVRAKDPVRCARISAALKGKPKSEEYKKSMIGHSVSEEAREKLRQANLGKKASEESKKKMSATRTGKSKKPNSVEAIEQMVATKLAQNLRWCNNGVEERLTNELPEGWVYGKIVSTIKGKRHYNNGIESRLFDVPPDDTWVPGRLKQSVAPTKGKRFYNNGVICQMFENPPEGSEWVPGILKKTPTW